MGEFIKRLSTLVKAADEDTVGWIKSMPPEGIKAAENSKFRLDAIEIWRPDIYCSPNFNDECSFEKYLSHHVISDDYKSDVLEGRCVYSKFPINTEFASCFTIIRKEDLDCNGNLNEDKINELKQYGTGHDSFIYIKSTNKHDKSDDLYNFAWSIHDAFNPIHDCYFSNGIVASDLFVRPVVYLSSSDYYRMGVEAEDISDIRSGLPVFEDGQKAEEYARQHGDGGFFGIFAKLNYFEKQREARIGVTFSRPIKKSWIDICAPSTKGYVEVCERSKLNTITFS